MGRTCSTSIVVRAGDDGEACDVATLTETFYLFAALPVQLEWYGEVIEDGRAIHWQRAGAAIVAPRWSPCRWRLPLSSSKPMETLKSMPVWRVTLMYDDLAVLDLADGRRQCYQVGTASGST